MKVMAIAAALSFALLSNGPPPAAGRYVSMGSSYASGPGVGQPVPSSGECARSTSNFAHIVARRLRLALTDVSCSGAVTDNILTHGQHGFPPQILAVTPETELVTILIGGNDVNYVGNLGGMSCRASGQKDCRVDPAAAIEAKMAQLPRRLDMVIAETRRRAPGAKIVLVGYLPALSTSDHLCAQLPLSVADTENVNDLTRKLSALMSAASQRNGIAFVDAYKLGIDHVVCSKEPYITGYRPDRNPAWATAIGYHPNQEGMSRVADAVVAVIERTGK